MKIAIIDSELNREMLSLSVKKRKNRIQIVQSMPRVSDATEKLDHSAMVINTIQKYGEDSFSYYLYEVMGTYMNGGIDSILKALQDCIEKKIEIILLCVTVTVSRTERQRELWKLCEKARKKNIFIFASAHNKIYEKSIPALFCNVIGVGRGNVFKKPYYSWTGDRIQISGDCVPEFYQLEHGRYGMFAGTSKAVPKIIGSIGEKVFEELENFDDLEEYLQRNELIRTNNIVPEKVSNRLILNKEILEEIIVLISTFQKKEWQIRTLDEIKRLSLMACVDQRENIDLLLIKVFQNFSLEEDLEKINFLEILTVEQLGKYVTKKIRGN